MAIAFDSVTSNNSITATSLTYSHTCGTWSDRMLFVWVSSGGGDLITGVTYAGASMTQVWKIKQWAWAWFTYLYALFAPATGANNIICSASSSTAWNSMATSYTGVTQSNTMDATASSAISWAALNFSTTLTTIANNCWSICYTINDTNIFASNSDTLRGTNIWWNIFDSNSAITPAGSKTMTQTVSWTGNWSVVMASFSPAGAVVSSKMFSFFLWA